MADEATGKDVTPPTGFKLRALVADPSTTATKNITPFTDMAVAVAGTASTKDAISNAELAIVNTVLGGDRNAYDAKPVAPTTAAMLIATADEKKLATLLTAVSAFAQDDATCKVKTTDGDRIKCATDTFATQAAATVTGVSDAGYTVAATVPANTPATLLSATLTKITARTITGITATDLSTDVTDDTSSAGTLLTSAEDKITTASSGGGPVVVPAGSASGIQAASDLFNSLKTDLAALSNGNGDGFLDQKLNAAKTDFAANGHASATGFVNFMIAINRATQMASDAKTWTAPASTGLVANAAYPVTGHSDLVLVTDSTGAASQFIRHFASTSINNQALSMNCRVNVSDMSLGKARCSYGYGKPSLIDATAGSTTHYFRLVKVALETTGGSLNWLDAYASRVYSSTQRYSAQGTVTIPVFGAPDVITQTNYVDTGASFLPLADAVNDAAPLTGTATLTQNSAGDVTAFSLKGNIQPLAAGQDNSTLDISAALTSDATTKTAALSGTVTNVKAGVTTLSMSLASGSQLVFALPTATTLDHATSANFVTQLKTPAFQYDGTLVVDTFTATAELGSGNYQPANASFTGKISAVENGAATEFLNGKLEMKQTNLADFNPTLETSASNFLKQTASFTGTVTNGATSYVVTFIADGSTFGQKGVTLNYTRSGAQIISVTGTTTATSTTLAISGAGNININLVDAVGDVKTGTTKVGSITTKNRVDFVDGTFLLLGV